MVRTRAEGPYHLAPICDLLDRSSYCWLGSFFTVCLMICLFGLIIRELLEIRSKSWIKYIWSSENVIQLFIIGLTIAFLAFAEVHMELAYHFSAWALFLAWLDLTLFVGRIDFFGEYLFIVQNVAGTLIKCLLVYFPILIGRVYF